MPTVTEVHEPQVENRTQSWEPVRMRLPIAPSQPLLFTDCLLETGKRETKRRGFATVLSFIIQCCLIGGLLLVPLMFTEELPGQQLLTFLMAPPPPPPPPPPAAAASKVRMVESDVLNSGQLRTPGRIPTKVQMIAEDDAPPPSMSTGGVVGGVPGGIPGGQLGGVIGGIVSQTSSLAAVPRLSVPEQPKRIRVSQGVGVGMLIHRVDPAYPALAKAARIQGLVVLSAVINKEGSVTQLALVSGHPMLVPAAIDAVKQWHYRPYLLNGQPVEVELNVELTFLLQQ
jgi:periplasmic protein TonB